MDLYSLVVLLGFVVASFAAGATGIIFRPGSWYRQLDKPAWRPPDWLFAPVWTVLYALIALSGWLVWREAGTAGAALPLGVYAVQLLLNAGWTPVFFGLHQLGLAVIEIVVLWVSIFATIVLFFPISAVAVYLLVPYFAWVTFASALNFAIWRRNRSSAVVKAVR